VVVVTLAACKPAAVSGGPPRPELLRGPSGGQDIATFVSSELTRSSAQHKRTVVYVGAPWCEPCRRFHDALTAGELDKELQQVRFIEFDADADRSALRSAGYQSKLIPLFNLPLESGRASDRQIEGSIKGATAVGQNLLPRLHTLLGQ
jgi:thiol-disulfide isomerase/thioredoxin